MHEVLGSARDALNPRRRALALRAMREEVFDIAVVGGGVTGAGVALDAATRGASVALLEAGDLASGTSSRSGKVFHGGLRYLGQLEFSLVRKAAHERNLMIERLCPHLARPTPFLYPLVRPGLDRLVMGTGLFLYDLLGGRAPADMPRHRHLGREATLREAPGLKPDGLRGGLVFYDAIVDDARHTLAVARTASRYGAQIATRVEVIGMLRDGRAVAGVEACDLETGERLRVRARCVVNAAGAWADLVQRLAGEASLEVRPAKGIHLVVPRASIASSAALITRTADSVLVARPWRRFWIIGTTDTPWNHDRSDPAANASDVDYLLLQANRWLRTPLRREDVVGVYAGVRPLLGGKGLATAAMSREHAVLEGPPRFITVTGGKYTTYRLMARDAVDAAARSLGREAAPSVSAQTPLVGAERWAAMLNQRARLAREAGIPEETIAHLLARHGSLTEEVLDLAKERSELARPLEGALDYLEAEIVYAATHEGALHLDDVLARRTHVAMETLDRGLVAAPRAATLMAEVLGWETKRREEELLRYRLMVEADRLSEQQATDSEAVAARRDHAARSSVES